MSQAEISKTVDFCLKAFTHVSPEVKDSLMRKLSSAGLHISEGDSSAAKPVGDVEKTLTPEEAEVLTILRSRRLIREDAFGIDSFKLDAIDGFAPRMERGNLGLRVAERITIGKEKLQSVDYLEGRSGTARSVEVASQERY